MANVTNKSINTGSVTNKALGGSSKIWSDQTYTWAEAQGDWNNPYKITNKSLNTATVANKSLDT